MTPRPREHGFTLIELIVVLLIVMILAAAVILASKSAKVSSRNSAMKTAAASIDSAIGSFNRMHPAVPDPVTGAQRDELVQRASGQVWSGNTGSASSGLSDDTGEWLLNEWPANPFATGGVQVRRYGTAAPCAATGQPGEVRVCRTGAIGAQTYRLVAWGRSKDNTPVLVYSADHGTR